MRIRGIAHNFPLLSSYSRLNKWDLLADADGLWVATTGIPGHRYFLGFMANHTALPEPRYGLSVELWRHSLFTAN